MPQGSGPSRNEYVSIRRYIIFSEVLALVSLLFGGMLLSGVALVVSVLGRRKAASGMLANQGNPLWQALYRSSFIAIVMCAVALVLNLISAIFLYPMLMEMLQTGDYGALFGFGQPGSSVAPGTGNSTWG